MRVRVYSGRRRVIGRGAPWEAWAVCESTTDGAPPVIFGGWGMSRGEAERNAVAALKRDAGAAVAGYAATHTSIIDT